MPAAATANAASPSAVAPPQPAKAAALRVQLTGQPLVQLGHGNTQALGSRLAALLALLAIEGPLPRLRIAAWLYPSQDAAAARRNLRQLLFSQRLLLEQLLDKRDELLSLRTDVALDLGDPPPHSGALPELLGSLRFDEQPALQQWLDLQRLRLQQRLEDALAAQASAEEDAGHLAAAIALAQRLIELSPGSEHAHRRLMRLHYLRGDRAAALAAFDRCELLLKQELSARPGAETLALLEQIEQACAPTLASARPVPAAVLRPPRLIGREAEWAQLRQAWAAGEGLLLLGEAGMGKSRLLGDLSLLEPGCLLVGARAGDDALPYALLSRLLRRLIADHVGRPPAAISRELARLLPELGDAQPIASEQQRTRFLNAVQALLASAVKLHGLRGIALDDLHFADAASLAALPCLLAQPELRWLAAARPAELGPAAQAVAEAAVEAPLRLQALSLPAVAELLASLRLPELARLDAAALYRQSGGNPLFLLELLKAWLAQPGEAEARAASTLAPPRVGELIMSRIGRLSMPAVQLARCAAVAGQDFSAELAAEVLGLRLIELTEPWAELESAQVLRDGSFAHDLIREAAIASVPPAIARGLHAQIAGFLSRSTDTPPGRLAAHWRAAGHWEAAAQAYAQAARQARLALRRIEEGQWLRQAAECARTAGNAQAEFESTLALAQAALCESLGPDMLELAQQALQLASETTEQLRALAVLAAAMAQRVDDFGPRRAACEQGIELARRLGQPALALQLALPLAGGLLNAREIGSALALLEPLRDWAEQEAEPGLLCSYYDRLGMALDYANRLVESAQVHERQCELARRHGLHEATATALYSLGSTLAKRGGLRPAVQAMEKGLQLARSQERLGGQLLHWLATLGWRYRDLGQYRQALALMEEALQGLSPPGSSAGAAFNVSHRLALAYAQLGQHARARQLLQAHEPAADDLPARRGLWLSHSAELARLAGDTASAQAHAAQALQLLDTQREDMPYRVVCLQACLLLPPEDGEAMAAGLAAWAAAHERFGLALGAHLRAIACALRAALPTRALGHAEAALGLVQRFDSEIVYKGEYWLVCAQALAQAGRRDRAQALLIEGRHWLARCTAEQVPPEFADSFVHRNPVNLLLRGLQLP